MGDDMQKRIFANNLNYYMSLRGKKQVDLSRDLGISLTTVNSWCTGTKFPRMDKIQMLADYFNIGKSSLIEERTSRKIPEHNNYLKYWISLSGILSEDENAKLFEMASHAAYTLWNKKIE